MTQIQPNKVLLFGVAASVIGAVGCKKYEDGPAFSLLSKTARITGEWELVDAPVLSSGLEIIFEFEKDGDAKISYTYSYSGYSYSYTYDGEWEFSGDKEQIEITANGDKMEFDILRLTNKELFLEDEYSMEYEFEKQ